MRVSKGVGTVVSGYDKGALADHVRLWQGWVVPLVALSLHLQARPWKRDHGSDQGAGKSGRPGQHGRPCHTWSGDDRVSTEFGEGAPSEPSRAQRAVPKATVDPVGTVPSEIPS